MTATGYYAPQELSDAQIERGLRTILQQRVYEYLAERQSLGIEEQDLPWVTQQAHTLVGDDARDAAQENRKQLADPDGAIGRLIDEFTGMSRMQPFLDDPGVEEFVYNGPRRVFYWKYGKKLRCTDSRMFFDDDQHLLDTIKRFITPLNRVLDASHPSVDATLRGGERLHASIPPQVKGFVSLTIRKHLLRSVSMEGLVERKLLTHEAARFVKAAFQAGAYILVAGGTAAGKTTFLNALAAGLADRGEEAAQEERIIVIESDKELTFEEHLPDVVPMEANDQAGDLVVRTQGECVYDSMRMRPTRIVLGEVRSGVALQMLNAWNTGHEGSAGTTHANDPLSAIERVAELAQMGSENLGRDLAVRMLLRSLHLVVHLERGQDGVRRVTSIYEPHDLLPDGTISGQHLWQLDEHLVLRRTANQARTAELIRRKGIDVAA